MRHERYDCEDCKKKDENKSQCKGCACDQLRKLQTLTEVDVFLSGGTVLEDVIFVTFDRDNCCAFFNDNETEPGSVIVVDCQFIQAIRFEAE